MRADSLPLAGPDLSPRVPALPAQRGMILNYLRFGDDGVDIIQTVLDWTSPLVRDPFEAAWHLVARRNPILRTTFSLDGVDGLVQAEDPDASIDIRWRDLPPPPAGASDHPFEAFLLADRRERFDLSRGPVARLTILRRADPAGSAEAPAYRAVLTFHHALLDGRSLWLLIEEATDAYAASRDGRGAPERPRPQFAEFVRWWHANEPQGAEDFWAGYLAGLELPQPMPGYLGASLGRTAEPVSAETVLSRADSDLIRLAASSAGLNSSTMVSAAWALLRARYGGVDDIVVAVARSCRRGSISGAEDVIGLAINTVPLRVSVGQAWSVGDLLTAVNEGIGQIRQHQRTPLGSALHSAGLPVDTSFVDSLVMFDRRRLQAGLPGGEAAPVSARLVRLPSYPLTLCAYDEPELHLSLIWDRHSFAAGAAPRMLDQLAATLIEFARGLSAPLVGLDLGRSAEAAILAGWNRTRAGYLADATIPALFAAQVASRPDAIALDFGTARVTYAELDRQSSALAWQLRRRGVDTDAPVGVAIERGPHLIAALLAVLKAGGACLPVDTASPPARVAAMVEAAGAKLMLVTAQTAAAVPELAGVEQVLADLPAVLIGGDDPPSPPGGRELAAPPDRSHPLSLAYLSFTSGSTGVPKGVAVPQRAVIRLISDPTFVQLGPGQRVLQLAPVAFDASTLEIWGALLTGATIVVAPPGPLGLDQLGALLRTTGVTVAWLTAGLFHQLAEADLDAIACVPVLLAGGDVLNPDTVRAALAARCGRPLVNGYGPTENTTFTTCQVMTDPSQVGATVPIGGPIQHTTVAVLDASGRPAPIGVTGELHAGGAGLARGYAGNPGATARAFVPDPSGTGARLYRTGDLARWRADGVLEFVGRVDDQIKIRGFRVEPGEVAAVLRAHPGVRDAVVLAAGEGSQRHLLAYVTPADGVEPSTLRPSLLRDFVAGRLPEYLVPTGFKAVGRLPLNVNGKLDRAALPAPDPVTAGPLVPPRGDIEERLANLWRQLLSAEGGPGGVGHEDSFFALGGNSLSAARLMFRIREVFGAELSLASFYAAPTLAACATAIDGARTAGRTAASAPRLAPAATSIGRRDRSAYRVAAAGPKPTPDRSAELAPHIVPLSADWALWRTVCLRGAGFPFQLLGALGDASLASAADDAIDATAGSPAREAYATELSAAVRRLSAALHEAAGRPALREAVAWQNRHALTTGIGVLLRHGREPAKRNGQHRQHEALVASYLQRYCAKNDTIGFFGPVSWSRLDDGEGLRITHAAGEQSLAARVTYLEGWAVRGIMAVHAGALRPWLVPRRMPFVGLDGTTLRLPLAPAVPLTPAEALILRLSDEGRDARQIAAAVLADHDAGLAAETEVYDVMARLADSHRLAWQVEVAPQDIRPEKSMRALLARVTDEAVRKSAVSALDELTAARDELAAAAGDPERVAAAMAGLEATFTRLAGAPPTRRAGELYAGRTLVYEECLRGDTVRVGVDALDGIRAALALVLDSARWFTAACGALYTQLFEEAYRQRAAELGTGVVPFSDFWLIVNNALFDQPPDHIKPAVRALRERWSAIFDLPADARRAHFTAAELRDRVSSEFPAQPLPWSMAVHHSPDLMVAGADAAVGGHLRWVLGELHPSIVTTRYATWLDFHEALPDVQAAMRRDLGGPVVWFAESAETGGTCTRLSNLLPSADDVRLVFAHDSCGYDQASTLRVGECDVISSPAGLRVRRRDGTFERPLLEVVGDLISTTISHCFDMVPPGPHAPRVSIDDLVVSRERWALPATAAPFADTKDESTRYLQARAWAAGHGLPRHVFLRFTGERKPIYADLTSLASIDLISRSLRRSRRSAGTDATVTVVEMVPSPEELWLTDASGQRYTAELRMVAVDQKMAGRQAADKNREG